MISLRTSQHDDIVALIWHDSIVVLQHRDSETDQLHMYKVLKIIWVDLSANINWTNVTTLCWFICICMCSCTMCATRPATIILSPIGKPAVKPDHQQWYGLSHDIAIQRNLMIRGLDCLEAVDLERWNPVYPAEGAGLFHEPKSQVHCLAGTRMCSWLDKK